MLAEEFEKRFNHHPPTESNARKHELVRDLLKTVARNLDSILTGNSYESQRVIEKLEEAMFWANADIARNQQ